MIYFVPTREQKKILDRDLNVSNYVYNRTLSYIKRGFNPFKDDKKLRDMLVTRKTKLDNPTVIKFNLYIRKLQKELRSIKFKKSNLKDLIKFIFYKNKLINRIKYIKTTFKEIKKDIKYEINDKIHEWELETHKDIRAGAVFDACNAYKINIINMKNGNQKHFNSKYRNKKKFGCSMLMSKQNIKIKDNKLQFTNRDMKNKTLYISERAQRKINKIKSINHDTRITKKNNRYCLYIPIIVEINELKRDNRIIGIDPGTRVLLSCFTNDSSSIEYKQDNDLFDELDERIKNLKVKHENYNRKKRKRKKDYNLLERRKKNLIDEIHWKSINHLLKNNDYIFIGKLDSQGFVKNGKNKTLNRQTNNLKPYLFRMRLLYKAKTYNKFVKVVPEHFTTQTCSNCGSRYNPEKSKTYNCSKCRNVYDRDLNSAKNILLKGILY